MTAERPAPREPWRPRSLADVLQNCPIVKRGRPRWRSENSGAGRPSTEVRTGTATLRTPHFVVRHKEKDEK